LTQIGVWHRELIDESDDSEDTRAIRELNDHFAGGPCVVAVQLTIRVGVTLIRRND
jgi:hypothetical protein